MKIIDFFDEEELRTLEKVDLKITNKDYSYDEICFILNSVNYHYEMWHYGTIKKKFEKVLAGFKQHFIIADWKCKKAYRISELTTILDKMNFMNKKIKDIRMTGNDVFICKEAMVTMYNNDDNAMKNDNWEPMVKITKDFIPDESQRNTGVSVKTPIVITFEDNTTFEILIKDISKIYLSENKLNNKYNYEYGINLNKLFCKALNHMIVSYEITKLEIGSTDNNYMDKRIICDDNFYMLYLNLDNGYNIALYNSDFISLFREKESIPIKIKEWKQCIKHYDLLFSKEAVTRASRAKHNVLLTKLEKDILTGLSYTNLNKGTKSFVIQALKEEEQQLQFLYYLVDCVENNTIEDLTEQDVIKKILEIFDKTI